MIAYLQGRLVHKNPTHVIIDVNGIGYHVNISLNTYGSIKDKEDITLFTHLHIKEDSHSLYGFNSEEEKQMFLLLISISGVGPSTGLMMQSSLSAAEIETAIINNDVKTIQAVKGIGGKTAQRIILELKDKVKKETSGTAPADLSVPSHNTLKNEALSALLRLGLKKPAAEKSVDSILKKSGNTITLEELIKLALKNI